MRWIKVWFWLTLTVSLTDMLYCRERRTRKQHELQQAFYVGSGLIRDTLCQLEIPLLEQIEFHDKTGDELILCFDGNPDELKALNYGTA